jgi:Domain of unknown function (DUF4188)
MAIVQRRVTAKIEGDFVVFLIGMRINRWWKVHKWFPVAMSMPKMLKELAANPKSGFLGVQRLGFATMAQYWRSMDQLMAYARARDAAHFPAWVAFNKKIASNGDVGIWHETYLVRAGEYECVYNNMPPYGLALATETVDAIGAKETAKGRLGKSDGSDAAVPIEKG